MKLLVASDIHGSLSAAKKIVAAFENEEANYLLFLGDALYHGPRNPLPDDYNPTEVAKLLNTIADQIIAVRGNCDSEVDQMLLNFPITAEYQNIPLPYFKLFATHGHIFDQRSMPASVVSGDLFVFGHIHIPILAVNENNVLILNPGSVSLPKEGHQPTYATITDSEIMIKTFDGEVYRDMGIRREQL